MSLIRRIKDYRTRDKAKFDAVADPICLGILTNAAYLKAWDETLNLISRNMDSGEGIAIVGADLAFGAGAYFLNKKFVIPAARAVRRFYNDRAARYHVDTALDWARTAIQTAGLAGLLAFGHFGDTVHNFYDDAKRIGAGTKSAVEQFVGSFERNLPGRMGREVEDEARPVGSGPKRFLTGDLAGNSINDLFSEYLGFKGVVPETLEIDYTAQVEALWQKKLGRTGRQEVREIYEKQAKGYSERNPRLMNLQRCIGIADRNLQDMQNAIDFGAAGSLIGLDSKRVSLLREMSHSINARSLMAYSMTELMPSQDGNLNCKITDFILRTGGLEFLSQIPALNDDQPSFGLFQFTPHAMGDVAVMNRAVAVDMRVPENVADLYTENQFRAAYLFAVNNLAQTLKGLSDSDLKKLGNNPLDKKTLVQLIATAHTHPASASRAFKDYLAAGGSMSYIDCCSGRIKSYAVKTAANYNALG